MRPFGWDCFSRLAHMPIAEWRRDAPAARWDAEEDFASTHWYEARPRVTVAVRLCYR